MKNFYISLIIMPYVVLPMINYFLDKNDDIYMQIFIMLHIVIGMPSSMQIILLLLRKRNQG